jgi:oligopeptide transport system substrate-binding protein
VEHARPGRAAGAGRAAARRGGLWPRETPGGVGQPAARPGRACSTRGPRGRSRRWYRWCRQIFDRIADGWRGLGVDAQAVERAPEAQAAAIARGDYDLAVVERSAPAPKPLFFLRPFTCAARSGYCNAGADALIDGARTMADGDARAEALVHAEAAMLADTPMIPLFVPVRWALVGRGVTGWTANQSGQHPFAALDIQETP